jgi:uncharacterized protein (DUF697 family)
LAGLGYGVHSHREARMSALFAVSNDPEVAQLIERCGYAAAALTILPLPGTEVLAVMPLHVGMVVGIGQKRGRQLTRESAMELLAQIGTTVGASLVGSRVATTAAKFLLPGFGGLLAAPFMFGSTLAIGAVADAWFAADGSLSEEQMRAVYARAMDQGKQSFSPDKARSDEALRAAKEAAAQTAPEGPSVEERLARLQGLKEQGLVDDGEFKTLRSRILGEL